MAGYGSDSLINWARPAATNRVGVIVGAVIGAILLLLLLLFLLWLLLCCCRKRRYEKEVANEIRYGGKRLTPPRPPPDRTCHFREDSKAPESRPPSRRSSLRSVMGYRTHAGLSYSSVLNQKAAAPATRGSARSIVLTPAGSGGKPAPLDYDHEYGYPV